MDVMELIKYRRYEEASKLLDRVIGKNPNNSFMWFCKGYCLGEMGRYEEAISCYNKVLQINTTKKSAFFEPALFNKGGNLYILGRYRESISCYNKVLQINPNYPGAQDGIIKARQMINTIQKPANSTYAPNTPKYVETDYSQFRDYLFNNMLNNFRIARS